MQKRFHTILAPENRGGNLRPAAGASVTVTDPNGALATIYSDNGVTAAANPLTSSATGYYEYYAADGRYTETIVKAGRDTVTISDILLEDPADNPATASAYQRLSRKRIAHRFPLMFPDYDAIITATGQAYIYPQAFAIDDAADEVFVLYCAAADGSSVKWVAVFDRSTDEYKSCFNVGPNRVSEGLAIRYEGANRYLYTEDSAETLGKYDITTLPATMANIPASATYNVGMDRQFAHRNGVFLVEQTGTPLGSLTSRTTMAWCDGSLNRIGATGLDKADTGYTSSTDSTYAPYLPKRQNIALGDGIILASYGGYTPLAGPSTIYGYQGIKVFTLNGERLAESLMDPLLMMGILEDEGITCTRIENEGVELDSEGRIYSLYVHKSRLDASASEDGLIVFEEFSADPDTIDFAAAVKAPPAYRQQEIEDGIWPRLDGQIVDPLLGTAITTLEQMLSFMAALDVKQASFYGSSNTITDINGDAFPAGVLVTIRNSNNQTFWIRGTGLNIERYWRVTGSAGARTQVEYQPELNTHQLPSADNTVNIGSTAKRIAQAHIKDLRVQANLKVPAVLAMSSAAASVTGTTSKTTLATVTVPGGLIGSNGALRISAVWSYTNSANNKTPRIELGATTFFGPNRTTFASEHSVTTIRNRGSESAQVGFTPTAASSFGTTTGANVTAAIDTTTDQTITFSGQLANSGETITLESWMVEVIPS